MNRFSSLKDSRSPSLRNQIRTVSEILTSEHRYLHLPFWKAIKFPRYIRDPHRRHHCVSEFNMAASTEYDLHMCETESESDGEEDTELSLMGVQPYQFEPYAHFDGVDGEEEEREGEDDDQNRLISADW